MFGEKTAEQVEGWREVAMMLNTGQGDLVMRLDQNRFCVSLPRSSMKSLHSTKCELEVFTILM